MNQHKHYVTALLSIFFLIMLLLLVACQKEEEVAKNDAAAETDATPVEAENADAAPSPDAPLVPLPQATAVFPQPEGKPAEQEKPVQEPWQDTPRQDAPLPTVAKPQAQPSPPPSPLAQSKSTQQLVEETQQLVEKSRRILPDFTPDLLVHFIDVGYGDATLVQTPGGKNILMDCGSYSMGRYLVHYLLNAGVRELDTLIVSTPDKEHVGGCDYIIQYFHVNKIYTNGLDRESQEYKLFISSVEDMNMDYAVLHEPLALESKDAFKATILTPYHGRQLIGNMKDNSLLLRLDYGMVGFLLASDCSKGCERELLEYYPLSDLRANVFKVGDHGSDDAATELFLDVALPEVSIISTATDDVRELPSPDTLSRLRKYGSNIFRTDYDGTIVVKSDGEAYSMAIERGIEHKDLSGKQNLTLTPYDRCRFIAHQYSNVYYPLECPYTPNIEPENRICFLNEQTAVDLGLVRLAKC